MPRPHVSAGMLNEAARAGRRLKKLEELLGRVCDELTKRNPLRKEIEEALKQDYTKW